MGFPGKLTYGSTGAAVKKVQADSACHHRLLRQPHQDRCLPLPEVAGLVGERQCRPAYLDPAVLTFSAATLALNHGHRAE